MKEEAPVEEEESEEEAPAEEVKGGQRRSSSRRSERRSSKEEAPAEEVKEEAKEEAPAEEVKEEAKEEAPAEEVKEEAPKKEAKEEAPAEEAPARRRGRRQKFLKRTFSFIMRSSDRNILLRKIGKPHGVKGFLYIHYYGEDPNNLCDYENLFLLDRTRLIVEKLILKKDRVILKFIEH